MVRAKFRLNSYTTEMASVGYEAKPDGSPDYARPKPLAEKRTLNFTPVYSDKAGAEDKAFWDATPSGSLQLGVVNQEAWKLFDLGQEYYLDFSPAS